MDPDHDWLDPEISLQGKIFLLQHTVVASIIRRSLTETGATSLCGSSVQKT